MYGKIEVVTDVPVEKPTPKEKPVKVSYHDGCEMLNKLKASELVELLEKCGGNIDTFVSSFDLRTNGDAIYGKFTADSILARTMFILFQPGNEPYFQKWNLLVKSYKMARLLREEAKAYESVENMPKPKKDDGINVWLNYYSFWLGDLREEKKVQARKYTPTTSDPAIMQLIDMFKKRDLEAREE